MLISSLAGRRLRTSVCGGLLLAGLVWWGDEMAVAGAQTAAAPTARAGTSRIAGRVVSMLDGHALPSATIVLAETSSGRAVQTVIASADGGFALEGVKPGKYSLQGVAPGYMAAFFDEHEQFSTAIVTGVGLPTEALVLRLPPGAVLSGHVTDEAGDPVRGAVVTLYHETHGEGTSRVTRFRSDAVDDLGAYEIGSLPAGNYFVSAKGTPWYAVHPPRLAANDAGPAPAIDPALNVVYPTMFYPGSTDSDGATPIPMKVGDRVSADLRLAPQPALQVTLHLGEEAQGRAVPQLLKPVFDGFEGVEAQVQVDGASAVLDGVPAGRYQLRQSDPRTGGMAKTSVIDLANGVAEVNAAAGEEPGQVTVLVRDAAGEALPAQTQITLAARERGVAAGQPVDTKGEAQFSGVKPGDYHLLFFGTNRVYHVLQLAVDGREVAGRNIPVAAGAKVRVTATIGTGTIAVEGIAKREGTPAAGAMIVLVPRDPDHNLELFRRDQSDLDGTFMLPNVTPGEYSVLAIADGWTLEWGRADVLTRYLAKGVPVTVPAAGRSAVRLAQAVPVQAR